MDDFSLPDRLEPITPTEPTRGQRFSPEGRRRLDQNPGPPKDQDDGSGLLEDDDDPHKIDENA